jgi:S-adenosylmethionine decarboxylase proenzyme
VVHYGPRISHLVAEIFDFDAAALNDGSLMRSVAEKIIHDLSLHLVEMFEGKFELGITVIAVISESHLALHTWPEFGYLHLDLVSCGRPITEEDLAHVVTTAVQPDKLEITNLSRYSNNVPTVRPGRPLPPPPSL